jgi:hypothetical protein
VFCSVASLIVSRCGAIMFAPPGQHQVVHELELPLMPVDDQARHQRTTVLSTMTPATT